MGVWLKGIFVVSFWSSIEVCYSKKATFSSFELETKMDLIQSSE